MNKTIITPEECECICHCDNCVRHTHYVGGICNHCQQPEQGDWEEVLKKCSNCRQIRQYSCSLCGWAPKNIAQELAKQKQQSYAEGFSKGSDTMYHETRKELPKSYQKGIKEERARIRELVEGKRKDNSGEHPESKNTIPSAFWSVIGYNQALIDILEALK